MATIDWKDGVARAVRRHRADLGISQEQLAESADLSRSYISHIESGLVDLSLTAFVKISVGLRMEPWELLKDAQTNVARRVSNKNKR
jgi:predicted transcriptional regulator